MLISTVPRYKSSVLSKRRDKGYGLKAPRRDAGAVPLRCPNAPLPCLGAHRIEQMERRLVLGLGKIANDTLVFSSIDGEMLWPDDLTRVWARVISAKNLPKVMFHALRHTHASMLIASGLDVLTISRRLGHSKPSTTLDVYGHLFKGGDAAAAAVDKTLG
jgi:integrase